MPVTKEAYESALANGGAIDLGSRAVFQITGSDRVRYLNGQLTNDVAKAKPEWSIYACITNHKGKLDGDVFVTLAPDGESFFLDAAPELRETLAARIEKYMVADDVELADVTDQWHIAFALDNAPTADFARSSDRLGQGFDLWSADPIASAISSEVAEVLRIERGIPKWGNELTPDVLPPEARLEGRAIEYEKGCYIGQEVISRIRSVGRVNRTLERLACSDDTPLASGMHLFDGEKKVGEITSATHHPVLGRTIALGFVKRGSEAPGTVLGVGEEENMLSCSVEIGNSPQA